MIARREKKASADPVHELVQFGRQPGPPDTSGSHDGIVIWKHFPHYWPLVRGIPRIIIVFFHNGSAIRSFDEKLLNKQPGCRWFEALWRVYDVTIMNKTYPAPHFTKRVTTISGATSKIWRLSLGMCISSTVAEMPVKFQSDWTSLNPYLVDSNFARFGPVFCLWLEVSSAYAQPITGQVTEVTCPVIGRTLSLTYPW